MVCDAAFANELVPRRSSLSAGLPRRALLAVYSPQRERDVCEGMEAPHSVGGGGHSLCMEAPYADEEAVVDVVGERLRAVELNARSPLWATLESRQLEETQRAREERARMEREAMQRMGSPSSSPLSKGVVVAVASGPTMEELRAREQRVRERRRKTLEMQGDFEREGSLSDEMVQRLRKEQQERAKLVAQKLQREKEQREAATRKLEAAAAAAAAAVAAPKSTPVTVVATKPAPVAAPAPAAAPVGSENKDGGDGAAMALLTKFRQLKDAAENLDPKFKSERTNSVSSSSSFFFLPAPPPTHRIPSQLFFFLRQR